MQQQHLLDQVGTGWYRPEAVAVDAAGDVFIADEAPKVVEVPAGCINNSACQITISGTYAYGVAVDGMGNVFIPDRSGSAPYMNADNTNNQVIVFSVAAALVELCHHVSGQHQQRQPADGLSPEHRERGTRFHSHRFPDGFPSSLRATTSIARSTTTLTPGGHLHSAHRLHADHGRPSAWYRLSETVTLTDNALNVTGATQSISVQGSGLSPEVTVPDVVGQTHAGSNLVHHCCRSGCGHGDNSIKRCAHRRCRQRKPGRRYASSDPDRLSTSSSQIGEAVPNVVDQTKRRQDRHHWLWIWWWER